MTTLYKHGEQVSKISFVESDGNVTVTKAIWNNTFTKIKRDKITTTKDKAEQLKTIAINKGFGECTHPTAFEDRCCTCGQWWN